MKPAKFAFILLIVIAILSLYFFIPSFHLQSTNPSNLKKELDRNDGVIKEAILTKDITKCNKILESQFGDLFDRYFCIISVERNASFCDSIDITYSREGWEKPKGIYDRNGCYSAAAIVLKDAALCEKIIPYYTIPENASEEEKEQFSQIIYLESPEFCKELLRSES